MARRNRKFGWHSGTLLCKDGKFQGDVYVQDDIVFSDVSAGTLGVTGGIDMTATTSAVGIDMNGGTFATANIRLSNGTLIAATSADQTTITEATLTLTCSTLVSLDGTTTVSGANTFTTGTGAVTIKGDMSIDAGKDFDMSAGAGTFATGTGAVSLDGDSTVAAGKVLYIRDASQSIASSADDNMEITSPTLTLAGATAINLNGPATLVNWSGRIDVTTGYETMFLLEGTLDSTGSSGGVKTRGFQIDLERTTAVVLNGDSRDQALKIDIKDSVGDHTAGYFIRAMDIKSEFDAAGKTLTALYGANFTAEVDNGTATDYMNVSFNSKCDGTVTNDLVNVRIFDESQGTITGDVIGLQFETKNVAPATGIREHVMEVSCQDSTGWQNLFHFTDATGGSTTCDTDAICTTSSVDSDGAIRIDVAGTAYYIPIFNAAHTTNSW